MDRNRLIERAAPAFPVAVLLGFAVMALLPPLPDWIGPLLWTLGLPLVVALAFGVLVWLILRTSDDAAWRAPRFLPVRGRWLAYLVAFLVSLPGMLFVFIAGVWLLVFLGVVPDSH